MGGLGDTARATTLLFYALGLMLAGPPVLATGAWSGTGVRGPESFDAVPFLDLLRDGYGQSWGLREQA